MLPGAMRLKRAGAASCVLLVMLSCTPSNVDPDADVSISGTVARHDGRPAKDARVALTKGGDLAFGLSVFATLGLACMSGESKVPRCGGARVVETDARGRYEIDVKGSDTQDSFGQAATMEMSSVLPRSRREVEGPGTTVRFQVQTERLNIPLRFWEPRVEARIRGKRAAVLWSRLPSTLLPKDISISRFRTDVRFARGGDETVWILRDVDSGARFDSRVLEDTSGNVAVTAEARSLDVRDVRGRDIDIVLRSGRYPYRGPSTAPASRGAPCSWRARGMEPVRQSPCAVTDGRFEQAAVPQVPVPCPTTGECPPGLPRQVVLHLEGARPVDLVVVRGCDSCAVDIRRAGRWEEVGRGAQSSFVVNPVGRPVTSSLRVRGALGEIREVSVWDGSERALGRGTFLRGVREDEVAPGIGLGGGRSWLWIAALVALLVAVVLLVIVARRRRATPAI